VEERETKAQSLLHEKEEMGANKSNLKIGGAREAFQRHPLQDNEKKTKKGESIFGAFEGRRSCKRSLPKEPIESGLQL